MNLIVSHRVKFIADQLVKSGHVSNTGRGLLGVQGQSVTPDLAAAYGLPANHGFLISGFANDPSGKSPAQSAGLQVSDMIIAVNGTTITGDVDPSGILVPLPPGTSVKVTVQRGNGQQTFTVTLGKRPPTNG